MKLVRLLSHQVPCSRNHNTSRLSCAGNQRRPAVAANLPAASRSPASARADIRKGNPLRLLPRRLIHAERHNLRFRGGSGEVGGMLPVDGRCCRWYERRHAIAFLAAGVETRNCPASIFHRLYRSLEESGRMAFFRFVESGHLPGSSINMKIGTLRLRCLSNAKTMTSRFPSCRGITHVASWEEREREPER